MKMKHTKLMAGGILLLLAFTTASAQSLADAAREARKNKTDQTGTVRHFDNDNLPTTDGLSVVGPTPSADAKAGDETKAPAADPSATAADKQKAADEWKDKIDKQKAKIDSLSHELDLDQRELRLRAAALYADPTLRSRNLQWDKEEAQYRSDVDTKQKAIDDARQQLEQMQDEARKSGATENNDNNQDRDKDKDKDKDKK